MNAILSIISFIIILVAYLILISLRSVERLVLMVASLLSGRSFWNTSSDSMLHGELWSSLNDSSNVLRNSILLLLPVISSIIHTVFVAIIIYSCMTVDTWNVWTIGLILLSIVALRDCMRNLTVIDSGSYSYSPDGSLVDKLFLKKGICCILFVFAVAFLSYLINLDTLSIYTGFLAPDLAGAIGEESYFWHRMVLFLPLIIMPRVVFLLFVYPHISRKTTAYAIRALAENKPLPYSDNYSFLADERYYLKILISKMLNKGLIVSNIETILNEKSISDIKLSKLENEINTLSIADFDKLKPIPPDPEDTIDSSSLPIPKKFMSKVKQKGKDIAAGAKGIAVSAKKNAGDFVEGIRLKKYVRKVQATRRQDLRQMRDELHKRSSSVHYAYISLDTLEQYKKRITEVMSNRGCAPPSGIKRFDELKDLNLSLPIGVGYNKSVGWSEFFIIQAIQPLLATGIFEDASDIINNALDNHAYKHVNGKQMKIINANNDPLYALDDE